MPRRGHTEEQLLQALRQAESEAKVFGICRKMGISERRASRLIYLPRSFSRYRSHRDRQEALRIWLRELAASRAQVGIERLTVLRRTFPAVRARQREGFQNDAIPEHTHFRFDLGRNRQLFAGAQG